MSEEVVRELRPAFATSFTQYRLCRYGIAGANGGTAEKPVGWFVAMVGIRGRPGRLIFGDRDAVQPRDLAALGLGGIH